jgi:hypothetical protein
MTVGCCAVHLATVIATWKGIREARNLFPEVPEVHLRLLHPTVTLIHQMYYTVDNHSMIDINPAFLSNASLLTHHPPSLGPSPFPSPPPTC